MRFKCTCNICGASSWVDGWEEADTNSAGVDEDSLIEDACEHIKTGGDYTLTDGEYYDED